MLRKQSRLLFYIFIFSIFSTQQSQAQNRGNGSITLKITDATGAVIPGASITLLNSRFGAVSQEDGTCRINNLPAGDYVLLITRVGYESVNHKASISVNGHLKLNFKLKEIITGLSEVSVRGKTNTELIRQQAYNVSAIDARKLYNTTYDLNEALNKVSGVRIRESGGLGSSFNFSLNGFTGNQVKFFLDGIPMDNFGTSFQMNNVPINLADRIEIYKGVVPVSLGSDALGGAVNIVTNPNQRNYLDASYSYGSFNTHKSAVNTGYTSKSGFTIQLNAFQNYSDNDYKVNVDVADLNTGVYNPMRVKQFHARYHNETAILNVGVIGKKYADMLLLGFTGGENQRQIQTGNRMFDVYGQRSSNGNILMPSFKYLKKDLFVNGLDLRLNSNFNFGQEQLVDTSFRQYNWLGQYRNKSSNPAAVGGELNRTMYKYRNNAGIATANLSYKLKEKHSFVLNNTFNSFNRKGKDQLDPGNVLNEQPRKTYKNILGLGYRYDLSEQFNLSLFGKDYHQSTFAYQGFTPAGAAFGTPPIYTEQNKSVNKLGYGAASSYFLFTDLQAKASYERTYRLPESNELFGNPTIDQIASLTLRPESSDNYNLGLAYQFLLDQENKFHVESNFIYRDSKNFIRPSLVTSGNVVMTQMLNQQDVRTAGIDGEIKYIYKDALTLGANLTYQDIRNVTRFENNSTAVSTIYNDRIPNMPYLYGNANAQYIIRGIGNAANALNIGYNLTYVHEYYLNWLSLGSSAGKLTIPQQYQHDINAVYSIKNGTYNIALECRNLFGANIYDNFSLQKPGRSLTVKLRYFIAGQSRKN